MSEEKKSVLDRITSLVSGVVSGGADEADYAEISAEEEARTKSPMNKLVEDSPMPTKGW